jgi:hypothetical protein
MVTIPRYRQRTTVPLGGLDYSLAFGPTTGDAFRAVGQVAGAAGGILGSVQSLGGGRGGRPASGSTGGEHQGAPHDSRATGEGFIDGAAADTEAKAADVGWRRQVAELMRGLQHQADRSPPAVEGSAPVQGPGAGLDAGLAGLLGALQDSRTEAANGLEPAARARFEAVSARREPGFVAEAAARMAQQTKARAQTVSLEREAQGVAEFVRLSDIDADQARDALASAVAERTARLSAEGLAAEVVRTARRDLLSQAHAQRITQAISRDPAAAEALLEADGGLIEPAARDGLAVAIQDERTRTDARDQVAALARGMADVAGDLDGLLARAGEAAGNDPAKADAYRAAALGLWHGARQARDAAEDAAWTGVLPHLTGGAVTAWTDLPADVWRALSPRQQAAVRERTESPYGGSDPEVLAELKDMVAKDPAGFKAMDLGELYGALAPEDAAQWRALQEEARTSGNGARAELAYISTVSRAVDRVMPTGLVGEGDHEAFRSGAYQAIAGAEILGDGKLKASELADACGEFLSDWLGQKEPAESWQRLFDGLIGRKPVPKKTVPPKPVVKPRPALNPDLGSLARLMEISSRSPKPEKYSSGRTRGGRPDSGGVSFGSYQLKSAKDPNTHKSRVDEFLAAEGARWAPRFNGMVPTDAGFKAEWKKIGLNEAAAFEAAQHAYMKRTHYDIQVTKILNETSVDITNRSYTLQDVVWSSATQHGPRTSVVSTAVKNLTGSIGPSFTDEQLIAEVYKVRTKKYPVEAPRFVTEEKEALSQLVQERAASAPLTLP